MECIGLKVKWVGCRERERERERLELTRVELPGCYSYWPRLDAGQRVQF